MINETHTDLITVQALREICIVFDAELIDIERIDINRYQITVSQYNKTEIIRVTEKSTSASTIISMVDELLRFVAVNHLILR